MPSHFIVVMINIKTNVICITDMTVALECIFIYYKIISDFCLFVLVEK